MPSPPFLCQFIDDVTAVSASDDPLAQLLVKRSRDQSDKPVLLLTSDYDPEATLLMIKLRSRGIACVRLNTGDIPDRFRIRYSVRNNDRADVEFAIGPPSEHDFLDARKISAVILRQFDVAEINFSGNELARTFALQQWHHAFQILQGSLTCEWISNPCATIQANDRMRQLSAARAAGFDIPETLITNDPDAARSFYRTHDGNAILKALHHHGVELGGKVYSMYARSILDSELLMLEGLAGAPCILQNRLSKKSELRVTVVGEKVFAAELGANLTKYDFVDMHRHLSDSDFPISKVERLPDKVCESCISLVKSLDLKYGAIDFVVDRDSRLVFLEVNPTGEWYWIESRTGLRITDAVADLVEDCIR